MSAAGGSRRDWGWHSVTDAWAGRIVAGAAVRPGELVVDIGAGRGALTARLVAAGAQVIAVELHPGRARRLRERFADAPVRILEIDALSFRLPHRPFRVVANPPYAISSPLVRHLLAKRSRLVAADLVLQRAVVRRFAEGRTSDIGRGRWQLTAGPSVPRKAFSPPPKVDSSILIVRSRQSSQRHRRA